MRILLTAVTLFTVFFRSGYSIVDINGKVLNNVDAAVDSARARIQNERKLRNDLFDHYDRKVRPSGNTTDTVSLYVSMMLLHIEGIDEKRQVIKMHTWTGFRWNDVRLRWDSPAYGNITVLHTSDEELWLPDVTLYNNAEGKDINNFGSTTIMIQSNGDVVWIPPSSFSAQCSMSFDDWPRDKHKCHLILGSWTQHGFDLDLELDDTPAGIDLKNYVENDQWLLTNVSASRTRVFYSCCPEPYVSLSFAVQLRRNPSHYVHTLVLPVVIILLASWLLFIIPDYRFRFLIGMLEILALCGESLFLYSIAPPSFSNPPIVRLVATSIGFILYALIWCMLLNMVRRSTKPVPKWIQTVFNPKLSSILLIRSNILKRKRLGGNGEKDADKAFLTVEFEAENNPKSEDEAELASNETASQESWMTFTDVLSRICLVHYAIGTTVLIILLW